MSETSGPTSQPPTPQETFDVLSRNAQEQLTRIDNGDTAYSGQALYDAVAKLETAEEVGRSAGLSAPLDSFERLLAATRHAATISRNNRDTAYTGLFESHAEGFEKISRALGSKAIADKPTQTNTRDMRGGKGR